MFTNLFPTVIFKQVLDDFHLSKINEYKKYINSLPTFGEDLNGVCTIEQQLLSNSLFSNLNKEIIKYSKKYLVELGHIFEDIQIASSWAPVFNKGVPSVAHNHVNSYLSGVYYLTDGSDIEFENPLIRLWNFHASLNPTSHNPRSTTHFQISPSPNTLIIFPSFLTHFVYPPQEDGRMSIAFNIIPKGEFGDITRKLYLK